MNFTHNALRLLVSGSSFPNCCVHPDVPRSTRQSEMADLTRRATRWVGTLSHGNVHVKFHDDRLRNGGDITY